MTVLALRRLAERVEAEQVARRGPGPGKALDALLDLRRPAAEIFASLGVQAPVARDRFAELDQEVQP